MGNFFSELFGIQEEAQSGDEDKQKPSEEKVTKDLEFAKQLLDAQNVYRKKHGAPPLTLNKEMCAEAQKWADHLAASRTLQHSDTKLGENLAMAGPTLEAQKAADMWYNEVKDYNFRRPGFSSGTGHFTQLVWKDSKEFGAGIAGSSSGYFAVGRYKPAGNITNPGHFEKNVLPA